MIFLSLFLLLLLLPACGDPGVRGSLEDPAAPPVASDRESLYVLGPTATPWPTFTPFPTPTVTPLAVPTLPPQPTATPWPRFPRERVPGTPVVGVAVSPEASPTPGGELLLHRVFLQKQSLLPFRGGDLPDYLVDRNWDRMPGPVPVVGSDVRYMLWVVAFDFTQAQPDHVMRGLIRWRSVPPGVDPVIMFETSVVLSSVSPFFYHALGADTPGIWLPGFYRVEFLDGRGVVVTHAEFEVRQ